MDYKSISGVRPGWKLEIKTDGIILTPPSGPNSMNIPMMWDPEYLQKEYEKLRRRTKAKAKFEADGQVWTETKFPSKDEEIDFWKAKAGELFQNWNQAEKSIKDQEKSIDYWRDGKINMEEDRDAYEKSFNKAFIIACIGWAGVLSLLLWAIIP